MHSSASMPLPTIPLPPLGGYALASARVSEFHLAAASQPKHAKNCGVDAAEFFTAQPVQLPIRERRRQSL
jgi:hypothetical protein